ncbi:hypothetical protein K439DRAFT_1521372 [Ramaria rubella]|nr:hypothetical protein K439DRAFT_1521372 [Ramaria rubella]
MHLQSLSESTLLLPLCPSLLLPIKLLLQPECWHVPVQASLAAHVCNMSLEDGIQFGAWPGPGMWWGCSCMPIVVLPLLDSICWSTGPLAKRWMMFGRTYIAGLHFDFKVFQKCCNNNQQKQVDPNEFVIGNIHLLPPEDINSSLAVQKLEDVSSLPQDDSPRGICMDTLSTSNGTMQSLPAHDSSGSQAAAAAAVADSDPEPSRGNFVAVSSAQGNAISVMMNLKPIYDFIGGIDTITQGMSSLVEGSEVLMKALDEVAKLHPFVGVAVLAFKAVWSLEMKCRENNKKVEALHSEMHNMIEVLVELKDIKDENMITEDDKGHMGKLSKDMAKDIEDCANTCDTYSKKKIIIGHNNGEEKVDKMIKMFQTLMSPEERVTRHINERGGRDAVKENEKHLCEVSKDDLKGALSMAVIGHKAGGKPYSFEDLQDDLRLDPDEAIRKNLDVFLCKFKMQQDRMQEEMEAMVKRESDRIIEAMTGSPHDKIINHGWRGSIKSRYFVMALHDFYHEKWGSDAKVAEETAAYQRIFNDDALGFLTVVEVNTFTELCPKEWSLPRWLAFWAISLHQSLVHYTDKIRETFAKMFAILPHIHPANRAPVHKYLEEVYQDITTVEASVNRCFINETLQEKFRDYLDGEEARLKRNLHAVKYNCHFEIMRICQKHIIHPDELEDAAGSIDIVMKALMECYELLKSFFRQQRLELKQQFANFVHIFQYINDPTGLWAPEIVKAAEVPEYPYDDMLEEQNIEIKDLLHYPVDQQELDLDAYGPPPEVNSTLPISVPASLAVILGTWNRFMYRKYWDGELDIEKETIMGTWGKYFDCTMHHGTFVLKRTAPEDLRFHPAPVSCDT